MPSISRRPGGTWRARYRDPFGKEHARHFRRKLDAQRWLDEVTTSLVTGVYVDPDAGKIPFGEWWQQWAARQTWTSSTVVTAELSARSTTFWPTPLRLLRRAHVEEWVKAMTQPGPTRDQGLAATTIRTRFNYVHMALAAAVRDRLMVANPATGVPLPRVRRREVAMAIPTSEQVRAAVLAAPAHFQLFVALCAFAGLRLGEAAGVQAGDVDASRQLLCIRRQVQGQTSGVLEVVLPKVGSERDIAIPTSLLDLITRHIDEIGTYDDERWLFKSGRHLLTRNGAGHQWRVVREQVGLDEFTLHDLRHFYASALIASGCDVVTVQRALGHASATITLNTYSHLWPTAEDRTRAAAADLIRDVLIEPVATPVADSVRTPGDPQAGDLQK